MTDLVALNDLRDRTRQRADQVNSEFVTDAELNGYINNAWGELYDLLVSKYNFHFLETTTITISSGTKSYSLPDDFYQAIGVDLIINSSDSVPIHKYEWTARNRGSRGRASGGIEYHVQGDFIVFAPVPSSNVSLNYIPTPRKLESITPTVVGTGSSTTYTVPSTHTFKADDKIGAVGFYPDTYNVYQTISSVGTTSVVTDLDSTSLGAVTTFGTLESRQDFFNASWQEFCELTAAILMMIKEESDPTMLIMLKGGVQGRIEAASQHRDAGEPMLVTDVTNYDSRLLY